jgi:glycosyltransferase involved in cell wall biosynthesis
MRVLCLQKTSGIGGCERQLLDLLPALAARGLDLRMCVMGVGQYARFVEPLRSRGIDTVVIPAGPRVNPLAPFRLIREIKRFRPDVVHTHLIHGDVYGQMASKIAGVPAVSSVHGTHGFYVREPFRTAARTAGHLARRTIAISKHVSMFLSRNKLVPEARIRLVYYGIDSAEWTVSPAERGPAKRSFGLRESDVVVGVASRLIPFKGHSILLDVFARALQREPDLRLLVAGDGPLRGDLERHARGVLPAQTFRFLGFLPDVRAFLAACDIVAFPSQPGWGEGFGLAALEAMAAGRPVIASDIESLPEIVTDGVTGSLVEPRDMEGLHGALVSLASSPGLRQRLGRAGRVRAKKEFTLGRAVEGVLSVYGEVV